MDSKSDSFYLEKCKILRLVPGKFRAFGVVWGKFRTGLGEMHTNDNA